MIEEVTIDEHVGLEAYAAEAHLAALVATLRDVAAVLAPKLAGRTVWMINSTSQGGGVAEMLPKVVRLLRDVGVTCRWCVIRSDRAEFFPLTKRLHNMIHGTPQARPLDETDRALYEAVNLHNAEALAPMLGPRDILVVHDPQPLALGAHLRRTTSVRLVFRSHIGVEEDLPASREAWRFLEPYARAADRSVFSLESYAPPFLRDGVIAQAPTIDPWSHKNRDLSPHKMMGILCNAGLAREMQPVLTPPFKVGVGRLTPDGTVLPGVRTNDVGLLYRPMVVQVSRWDRLKGFLPLLQGFVALKERRARYLTNPHRRHARRLELTRLALAGPDPSSIQDDPEAHDVFRALVEAYRELPRWLQEDVAIYSLPMVSRKENALAVNALQRCATVVVQNSLREGFGLTATEALWKRVPVLGTTAAGLRSQIRDGVDGLLTKNPDDPEEIADHLDALLANPHRREAMGSCGQRRVHDEFLVFSQVASWLRVLSALP